MRMPSIILLNLFFTLFIVLFCVIMLCFIVFQFLSLIVGRWPAVLLKKNLTLSILIVISLIDCVFRYWRYLIMPHLIDTVNTLNCLGFLVLLIFLYFLQDRQILLCL